MRGERERERRQIESNEGYGWSKTKKNPVSSFYFNRSRHFLFFLISPLIHPFLSRLLSFKINFYLHEWNNSVLRVKLTISFKILCKATMIENYFKSNCTRYYDVRRFKRRKEKERDIEIITRWSWKIGEENYRKVAAYAIYRLLRKNRLYAHTGSILVRRNSGADGWSTQFQIHGC